MGSEALNQLSTKVRPDIRYKPDRMDLDSEIMKGGGKYKKKMIVERRAIPYLWYYYSDLLTKKQRKMLADAYASKQETTEMDCIYYAKLKSKQKGKGADIHKGIIKLPTLKKGWTLPGHKYTGLFFEDKPV